MPTILEAQFYWTTWAFGNCIHVSSVKEHLTTCDNGVITTFEQECVSWPNDQLLQNWSTWDGLKKILDLNYGVLTIVVLLCNCVKTNYVENNATTKQNEYNFIFLNFNSLIPISDQSFVFPLHVDQSVFCKWPKGKKTESGFVKGILKEINYWICSNWPYRIWYVHVIEW